MNNDFDFLWGKAAQLHGHKCPSLFYGVTLVLFARRVADNGEASLERIVLEGSSKCIRDGVSTGLKDADIKNSLQVITDSSACALTIGTPGSARRFVVIPQVRRQINKWHRELPLAEFQSRGVAYLKGLKDDEFICQEAISTQQFEQLCNRVEKHG